MIKIHRDNRVVFWLLIGGLVLNILWSFRLELQAKATKSIVEEYHLNLNKKVDRLEGLKSFYRMSDRIYLATKDNDTFIALYDEDDVLYLRGGLHNLIKMYRTNDGHYGTYLKSGDKESARMRLSPHNIDLGFNVINGSQIKMSRNKGLIEIRHDDSILKMGNTPHGEGISIGQKGFGSLVIRKGKGVGLTSTKQIILEARGERGKLSIVSDGDINITSWSGEVNIVAKKINMKKPAKARPLDKEPKANWSPTPPPKLKSMPVPLEEPPPGAKLVPLPKEPEAKLVPLPKEPEAKRVPLPKEPEYQYGPKKDPPPRLKPSGPYLNE